MHMKRTVTPIQQRGKNGIFREARARNGASCAFCRHAQTMATASGHELACTRGLEMDASTCPSYRDARQNLDANHLRTQ